MGHGVITQVVNDRAADREYSLGDVLTHPDTETVDTHDLSAAPVGLAMLVKMEHACLGKAHFR